MTPRNRSLVVPVATFQQTQELTSVFALICGKWGEEALARMTDVRIEAEYDDER